jgi:addiction module HigA family antidote
VPPARVNDIASEKRGITADRALRLSRYFGTPKLWMNLQERYELETARREVGGKLAHIPPCAA